ncbi:16S rRNA (cytidine(1402)-2'-O)-methyltransferase [Candidatus Woesearchaeota archaeon]|nr:16S rRNA (cytidine(1402)-2'-O)-methyltransferase [Candidatus Woesearchaeota archaeon]
MLYILSTPIGNLKDVSYRALEIFNSVNNILCEDTRRTVKLLEHYKIAKKNLLTYNDHNKEKLVSKLNFDEDYILVTDNGTPSISDPGYFIVNFFRNNKKDVTHIPGPSAFLSGLVLSGFPTDSFSFHGFLPKQEKGIVEIISDLISREETLIFYESPHRIHKTLQIIYKFFPNVEIAIARELTKKFEEVLIGTAKEIIELKKEIKGEIVLLIKPYTVEQEINNEEIVELYNIFKKNSNDKIAIKKISSLLKINKNTVYNIIKKN